MSQDMITVDSQEVFSIEESTTTFTNSGNTIQNVTICVGGTTYCFSKHSECNHETVGVHNIGDTEITVYRAKIIKKIKRVCGAFWTVIRKVE